MPSPIYYPDMDKSKPIDQDEWFSFYEYLEQNKITGDNRANLTNPKTAEFNVYQAWRDKAPLIGFTETKIKKDGEPTNFIESTSNRQLAIEKYKIVSSNKPYVKPELTTPKKEINYGAQPEQISIPNIPPEKSFYPGLVLAGEGSSSQKLNTVEILDRQQKLTDILKTRSWTENETEQYNLSVNDYNTSLGIKPLAPPEEKQIDYGAKQVDTPVNAWAINESENDIILRAKQIGVTVDVTNPSQIDFYGTRFQSFDQGEEWFLSEAPDEIQSDTVIPNLIDWTVEQRKQYNITTWLFNNKISEDMLTKLQDPLQAPYDIFKAYQDSINTKNPTNLLTYGEEETEKRFAFSSTDKPWQERTPPRDTPVPDEGRSLYSFGLDESAITGLLDRLPEYAAFNKSLPRDHYAKQFYDTQIKNIVTKSRKDIFPIEIIEQQHQYYLDRMRSNLINKDPVTGAPITPRLRTTDEYNKIADEMDSNLLINMNLRADFVGAYESYIEKYPNASGDPDLYLLVGDAIEWLTKPIEQLIFSTPEKTRKTQPFDTRIFQGIADSLSFTPGTTDYTGMKARFPNSSEKQIQQIANDINELDQAMQIDASVGKKKRDQLQETHKNLLARATTQDTIMMSTLYIKEVDRGTLLQNKVMAEFEKTNTFTPTMVADLRKGFELNNRSELDVWNATQTQWSNWYNSTVGKRVDVSLIDRGNRLISDKGLSPRGKWELETEIIEATGEKRKPIVQTSTFPETPETILPPRPPGYDYPDGPEIRAIKAGTPLPTDQTVTNFKKNHPEYSGLSPREFGKKLVTATIVGVGAVTGISPTLVALKLALKGIIIWTAASEIENIFLSKKGEYVPGEGAMGQGKKIADILPEDTDERVLAAVDVIEDLSKMYIIGKLVNLNPLEKWRMAREAAKVSTKVPTEPTSPEYYKPTSRLPSANEYQGPVNINTNRNAFTVLQTQWRDVWATQNKVPKNFKLSEVSQDLQTSYLKFLRSKGLSQYNETYNYVEHNKTFMPSTVKETPPPAAKYEPLPHTGRGYQDRVLFLKDKGMTEAQWEQASPTEKDQLFLEMGQWIGGKPVTPYVAPPPPPPPRQRFDPKASTQQAKAFAKETLGKVKKGVTRAKPAPEEKQITPPLSPVKEPITPPQKAQGAIKTEQAVSTPKPPVKPPEQLDTKLGPQKEYGTALERFLAAKHLTKGEWAAMDKRSPEFKSLMIEYQVFAKTT